MKVNKLFLVSLFSFTILISYATDKKKKGAEPVEKVESGSSVEIEYSSQKNIYKTALKYGDFIVARTAIYKMMDLKPDEVALKDTLAILYFKTEAYPQAILLSRDILEKNTDNNTVLEIKAISEQNVGLIKESLESYEALYGKTQDAYHLYQIATLQYQLKRLGECNLSVRSILTNKDAEEKKVNIVDQNQRGQEVPLYAACYNLLGVMALGTNDAEAADKYFNKAVELFPEFTLAKANIDAIKAKDTKPTKK